MIDITKLDKKRSYGIVTGDPNVRYVQDGHSYREDGTLYVAAGKEPPVPPPHVGTPAVEPEPEEVSDEIKRAMEASNNRKRQEAIQRVVENRRNQERKSS